MVIIMKYKHNSLMKQIKLFIIKKLLKNSPHDSLNEFFQLSSIQAYHVINSFDLDLSHSKFQDDSEYGFSKNVCFELVHTGWLKLKYSDTFKSRYKPTLKARLLMEILELSELLTINESLKLMFCHGYADLVVLATITDYRVFMEDKYWDVFNKNITNDKFKPSNKKDEITTITLDVKKVLDGNWNGDDLTVNINGSYTSHGIIDRQYFKNHNVSDLHDAKKEILCFLVLRNGEYRLIPTDSGIKVSNPGTLRIISNKKCL
jgi:hypothetical protein